MKPDIVVTKGDETFVMDTKWKVLSDNKINYGIYQPDMYQMYSYQKKYNAQNVTLLYPKTENISSDKKIKFTSNDKVTVQVNFVDLLNIESMDFEHLLKESQHED